jgi:hypothetical protein
MTKWILTFALLIIGSGTLAGCRAEGEVGPDDRAPIGLPR